MKREGELYNRHKEDTRDGVVVLRFPGGFISG